MEVSVGRQPKGQLWLVLAVLVAFAMLGEAARSLPPPSLSASPTYAPIIKVIGKAYCYRCFNEAHPEESHGKEHLRPTTNPHQYHTSIHHLLLTSFHLHHISIHHLHRTSTLRRHHTNSPHLQTTTKLHQHLTIKHQPRSIYHPHTTTTPHLRTAT